MLRSDLRTKMHTWCLDLNLGTDFVYVISDYILHIYVERTDLIDTVDTDNNSSSETIVYCEVLDTLKGQVFPSLDNAIFWNGERDIPEEGIMEPYSVPNQTDIIFSFCHD